MRKSAAASVFLMMISFAHGQAAEAQDREVQRTATDALNRFVQSWNLAAAGDPKGVQMYGDIYWPEADLVDPSGNVWNGQPAVVQMHVDLWAGPFNGSNVRGVVRKARRLSPSILIADLDLALFAPRTAPPGSTAPPDTIRAHLKLVMEKRGEVWKTISSQNTFYSMPVAVNRSSAGFTDTYADCCRSAPRLLRNTVDRRSLYARSSNPADETIPASRSFTVPAK